MIILLGACTGINIPGNEGPVWIGEPVVTDHLDENDEPIDPVTYFDPSPTKIYCYLSIRGPAGFTMSVRWYREGQLIGESFVDFGEERKATPYMDFRNGQAIPPGKYRCEYVLGKEPLRSIEFTVAE